MWHDPSTDVGFIVSKVRLMTARGEIQGHIQGQFYHACKTLEGYGHNYGCSNAKPSLYTWGFRQECMVYSGTMNNTTCEKGNQNQKNLGE